MKKNVEVYNKDDLVASIAQEEELNMKPAEVKAVLHVMEKRIKDVLMSTTKDKDVELKLMEGVIFQCSYVPAHVITNNLTKKEVKIEAKLKPKVKLTKTFGEKISKVLDK